MISSTPALRIFTHPILPLPVHLYLVKLIDASATWKIGLQSQAISTAKTEHFFLSITWLFRCNAFTSFIKMFICTTLKHHHSFNRVALRSPAATVWAGLAVWALLLQILRLFLTARRQITSKETLGNRTDIDIGVGGEVVVHGTCRVVGNGGVGDNVGVDGDGVEGWRRPCCQWCWCRVVVVLVTRRRKVSRSRRRLGCPRNYQFFSVRTETNRNTICFGCFSVWFVKSKKCFGLFRCFGPVSKQPKQTELFRNKPKKSPNNDLYI